MKLLEKILLATDFSDGADYARQAAVAVAKQFHADIILLHVIPPELGELSGSYKGFDKLINDQLQGIREDIVKEGVKTGAPIVLEGAPFDQIIRCADLHNVNMIMLGSGEEAEKEKFLLGLTAARLIRNARKPVWIVKKGSPLLAKRILCPVDFSDHSQRALKNAIHLARKFEAELLVLHVLRPVSSYSLVMKKIARKEQERWKQLQHSNFDAFLKKMNFHKVKWEKMIREGKPAEEILSLIAELKPDLLAIGTLGKSQLDRLLVGSVAEKVIREIPCSTIMVKSEVPIRLKLEKSIKTIEDRLKRGHELLENGFALEAADQFEQCTGADVMFAPAWEGLAAAYRHLGREKEAEECRKQAQHIRQALWERQVEYEIRKQTKISGEK